jgi:hypothetical protein
MLRHDVQCCMTLAAACILLEAYKIQQIYDGLHISAHTSDTVSASSRCIMSENVHQVPLYTYILKPARLTNLHCIDSHALDECNALAPLMACCIAQLSLVHFYYDSMHWQIQVLHV